MFVSPQNIRYLFTVKGIILPFAWLSILIWSFIKVPAKTSFEPFHTNLSGSSLSWAWLSALNAALGNYATLSVNIPDFTVNTKISLPSLALPF
jgi:nucleobase:cation symporter-1, NCS1 family